MGIKKRILFWPRGEGKVIIPFRQGANLWLVPNFTYYIHPSIHPSNFQLLIQYGVTVLLEPIPGSTF